ncbi:FMN-binding negative transcriptional regulator [Psychrobacter sp. DAB_AL62B]|uniref:FMN-binding negative transcriptional regulator n=1 Tax=Psychrobacter sp. DAB_AL62B TaxID=1028420 RepID=UPI0023815D8B|nr:FMN-binding negative transcriptional regulator [Psychrobacter sp. DAB_AL62B]MDE4454117.1 FMN-binding negative transcriptional regulator [Psychrobacter sp. DAB_AL62B]
MHTPSIFAEENLENILNFIAAKPLASLIAQTSKGIEACHIPLFWHDDHSQYGCLYGHFGRKNSIYQDALPDTSWLIIFQDTGHYISPNWYPSKAKTHKEVPTWNYQSIHIQSKIELIEDTDKLKWLLKTMTAQQEIVSDNPWSLEDAPAAYIDAMCRGIIGFKFPIDSIQAQFKLSQNKTAENIAGVITDLEKLNTNDAAAMAIKVAECNHR